MKTVIAVDPMGGDHGPSVTVPASLDFLAANPEAALLLVGLKDPLEAELARTRSDARSRITVVPVTEVVGMDEDVRTAIRTKKNSSMRVAIDLVKEGRAGAMVSAGNTGALTAISHFVLKTVGPVERDDAHGDREGRSCAGRTKPLAGTRRCRMTAARTPPSRRPRFRSVRTPRTRGWRQ